jgi:hypothetical protein
MEGGAELQSTRRHCGTGGWLHVEQGRRLHRSGGSTRRRPPGHGQLWHVEEAAQPWPAVAHGRGRRQCTEDGGGSALRRPAAARGGLGRLHGTFDLDLVWRERARGEWGAGSYTFKGFQRHQHFRRLTKKLNIILYLVATVAIKNVGLFSLAYAYASNITLNLAGFFGS